MKKTLFALLLLIATQLCGQNITCHTTVNNVQETLDKVSVEMKPVRFTNKSFDIFTEGGHLQGIQAFKSNGKEYLVATGSSLAYSYYVVVELHKDGNKVVHYKEIAPPPYNHAGGIQMLGTYLAVGVEDDQEKNRSKIIIFDLAIPGETDITPLAVIEREGMYKETTAGAVGFTCHDGQYLLAVASWDAKTIDFYRSNLKPLGSPESKFTKVATWHENTGDRSDWVSRWWPSYQGLNLMVDHKGNIHMLGFYRNKDGNFTDHFTVQFGEGQEVQLVKQHTKQYFCVKGAHFRAGGGAYILDENIVAILAVDKSLKGKVMVNWFQ